jgi:hypothetical protein
VLFEETELKSTFYAPYGVSILDQDGILILVDVDRAVPLEEARAQGKFAAFCGKAACIP